MISVVGLGKAGKCLINNFKKSKIDIENIYDIDIEKANYISKKYNLQIKKPEEIESKIVFICVPDNSIEKTSKKIKSKEFHIHLSGYFPSSILNSRKKLAFHPNSPLNENVSLKNVVIDIEGEIDFGKEICSKIGARSMIVSPEDKKRLHLMAVINSNFFLALMYISKKIFSENWEEISQSLVLNTFKNIINKGFKKALTGPVARDDIVVIEEEKEIFSKYFSEEFYEYFIKILKEVKNT